MATMLDVGLISYFLPVFVWMLVTVILWALLEKIGFFPNNKFANLLIAFILGILFILVPELTQVISLTTPWFVMLMIFLLFIILVFMFMGVKGEAIATLFGGGEGGGNQVLIWAIIIISLGIFGYAFTQVYGEQIHAITAGSSGETAEGTSEGTGSASGDLMTNIGQIAFTPKIMGMFFLLLMATFVVKFISTPAS
jgi:hypothetical protein